MVFAASLVRSEIDDQIDQCAGLIAGSNQRLTVFKSVYRGKKKVRSIPKMMEDTGLNEKQVRAALTFLYDNHMCEMKGRGKNTRVMKDEFCRKHRDRIIRAAENPTYREKLATKKNRPSRTSISDTAIRPSPKPIAKRAVRRSKPVVVCLSTNPHRDLRTDVEYRAILNVYKRSENKSKLVLENLVAATVNDLLDSLNESKPMIVHFSGHGDEGSVLLDDEHGGPGVAVDFDLLKQALEATDNPPKIIVLNSCLGAVNGREILGKVQHVVAMKGSIGDEAAAVFGGRFYAAVFGGQSISTAVNQAKVALKAIGSTDAELPTLLSIDGANAEKMRLV